jgi:hypothetical protein
METWYSKDLGDRLASIGPSQKIQDAFLELVKTGSYSPDTAVFSMYNRKSKIVTVYFTPSASLLASACGATPCGKPVPHDKFALLVGDHRNWEIHFSSYPESLHIEQS